MDGVLVVDKPSGPTSFEVVDRVRRALGEKKAGHTGTLDPMATGVLAVCLGEAVKLQQFLTDGDKAYQATVAFGAATDTEDAEGRVTERGDPSGLSAGALEAALTGFVGESSQLPPMYSAVRVGGRRLHEAARAGDRVARAPRRVRIHSLELASFEPARDGLALARIAVRCGKGTYVRTLAADLGRAVGVPAHLAALRRTAAAAFTLEGALPLAEALELGRRDPAALAARLVAPAAALPHLPLVALGPGEVAEIAHGRSLPRKAPGPLCRAVDGAGRLVAICAPDPAGDRLRPLRVMAQPREKTGMEVGKR